jgi:hypothetical protein
MARQERPVDPNVGPVQALAYELRKLRIEAGAPTYRALARKAGYSATTLSEAAGGLRKPTLDVVLAYAGACGGDLGYWRGRWTAMHDALGSPSPTDPSAAPPALPITSRPAGEPSEEPVEIPRPRPWRLNAIASFTGLALMLSLVAVVWAYRVQSASSAGPECPKVLGTAAFTGLTYGGGAHVRSGATRDDPILRTIPANCTVGFEGYCIGQKTYDNTAFLPDTRWFKVPDGVVMSGVIHGNPPRGLPPTDCLHSRPAPASIHVDATANPSTLTVKATGVELQIVGFTASARSDPAVPGGRAWKQLALAEGADGIFSAEVPLARLGGEGAVTVDSPIIVVATACLGGDGPTSVIDASFVRAGAGAPAGATGLTPDQLAISARSACQYPSKG